MIYVTFNNMTADIRKNIQRLQPSNYDLIVGLPRSGIIPAYTIALHLNANCTDLMSFIHNNKLKLGRTRPGKYPESEYPHEANNILIVDDSISSGNSLKNDLSLIPVELRSKITTCAIYSSKRERDDVDIFLEFCPLPRIFEWNLFHHPELVNACLDIDGVLCVDPTKEQNDDGINYTDFILNAEPLFIPTVKVHALVTSRLEKYREHTQTWLKKHNIRYEKLIMLDLPSKEERQRLGNHGKHKAGFYHKSECTLFIESEFAQSIEINKISKKPVICVDENIIINNDFYNEMKEVKANSRTFLLSKTPKPIKFMLKKLNNLKNNAIAIIVKMPRG